MLDARIGYGFGSPEGVLTPFAAADLGGSESRLRLGTRFEAFPADLVVELSGERRHRPAAEPVDILTLDIKLRR